MGNEPDLEAKLRAWSYLQMALDRPERDAGAALERLIAVYSSHPSAPLTLAARMDALNSGEFRELEEDRRAIRIPAMRLSIFLTATETAPVLFAATRHLAEKVAAKRLAWAGLDTKNYARVRDQVLALVQRPATTVELQKAIPIEERLMTAVRLMAQEGVLLRLGGSLRTDSLRYVATEAWLGRPLPNHDPVEARRWLAATYLRRFGPARVQDVAWWIGIPVGAAREALLGADHVDVGSGHLIPGDLADAFAAVEPVDPAATALLPKWDVYTMAYEGAGRRRFLADADRAFAYSRLGDGNPLLLEGGQAVATWSHRFSGDRMSVTVTPFPGRRLRRTLQSADFERLGRALDAREVEVVAGD
jgi:hypothetical protein